MAADDMVETLPAGNCQGINMTCPISSPAPVSA